MLEALPGPLWLWVAAWAAVVPLRPVLNGIVEQAAGSQATAAELFDRVGLHAVLGLIVAVALIGTAMLFKRATAAAAAASRLDPTPLPFAVLFRGMDSVAWPLLLTLALAAISAVSTVLAFSPLMAVVDTPMLYFVSLPIAGFVWTYGVALISVDRLGRRALALDPFPQDRTLGLRPVGSLAFTGFVILSAASILFLVFIGHYLTDILIGVGVFVFGISVFVLSMWRLHRQMEATKKPYLERARALYAEAYQPLRTDPSLSTLNRQATLLSAAEGLEKRAESIFEWPIDDAMLRWLVVITTGVLTSLVVRGIFALFGL